MKQSQVSADLAVIHTYQPSIQHQLRYIARSQVPWAPIIQIIAVAHNLSNVATMNFFPLSLVSY